jgi:hypothetical protein
MSTAGRRKISEDVWLDNRWMHTALVLCNVPTADLQRMSENDGDGSLFGELRRQDFGAPGLKSSESGSRTCGQARPG